MRATDPEELTQLVSDVDATRVVFGAIHEESLWENGLEFIEWGPAPEGALTDPFGCDKVNPDCPACAANANVYVVLEWGCIPDYTDQPPTCCENMERYAYNHPCVKELFRDPTIATVGNPAPFTRPLPFGGSSQPQRSTKAPGGVASDDGLFWLGVAEDNNRTRSNGCSDWHRKYGPREHIAACAHDARRGRGPPARSSALPDCLRLDFVWLDRLPSRCSRCRGAWRV